MMSTRTNSPEQDEEDEAQVLLKRFKKLEAVEARAKIFNNTKALESIILLAIDVSHITSAILE